MKKKRILLVLLGVFLIIQLIPVERPEVIMNNPNDLIANNDMPETIQQMFRSSCYDCHSNETVYPWYSYVAPVSFLISEDTKDGRRELNFSLWEELSDLEQIEMLDEIAEELEDGEMPLKIYPIMHPQARLSDDQRKELKEWAEFKSEFIAD